MRFLEKLSGGPLTLGKALRAVREGEEVSLASFAKRLDVSRQNLCDIEQGRRSVSLARAAEWATVLGYSATQFVRLALQDQIAEAGLQMRVRVDTA